MTETLEQQMARLAKTKGETLEQQIARMSGATERQRPRGYRTPEQIKRLNKNDMAAAREQSLGPFQTIAGGLQAAGQGLTGGWGDEIAAGLRTPLNRSGDYQKNLADVREEQAVFRREHPKADIALQVAGGVLGAKGPFKGTGIVSGLKNAAAIGGVAGAGYADGDLGDRAIGALGGGLAGPVIAGAVGGAGALARGIGGAIRRVVSSPSEKALTYLQKLAAARSGGDLRTGLASVSRDIADARAAGGAPVMAEGLGESGLRALQATTTAPLSQAGEITRTALGTRGQTVLPRADAAALKAAGLTPEPTGVRGPEYVNDWLNAIRTDVTRPLYQQMRKEAVAKEAIPSKVAQLVRNAMEKANIRALPAPGQSVSAKRDLPNMAQDVAWPGVPRRVRTETSMQETAREALLSRRPARTVINPTTGAEERPIILRAANDVNVRRAASELPAVQPVTPQRSAVEDVQALVGTNREVRALMQMLKSDPRVAPLMENPTSFDAMEAIYHAANARIKDLTGGTARSRVQEKALKNIAASFLRGMEEVAPTARPANKAFAELSQPQESFAFGRGFDKETPESIDKAIQTGFLPDGTRASIESVRLGVVQRLRELLVKRAGSQALSGAAKTKDALAGLNNEQLSRQLKVALGKKYDEMVPVLRQLLREEGTRMYATGGKNVAEGVIPEGANLADVFGAFSGGLGFGMQAAARRTTAAALKGGIKERLAVGFGKGADARAQMLTSEGQTLNDWLTKAARSRSATPEEFLTKRPVNRAVGGILTSIYGRK